MKYNEHNLKLALEHITNHMSNEKRTVYINILDKALYSASIKCSNLYLYKTNTGICRLIEELIGIEIDSMEEEEDMDHDDYNALEDLRSDYHDELMTLIRLIITPCDLDYAMAQYENDYLDTIEYSPLFTNEKWLECVLNEDWYTERVKVLSSIKSLIELDIKTCKDFLESIVPNSNYYEIY